MFKVDKSNELSHMLHSKKHSSNGRSVESLIGEYGEKKDFLELHSLMENTDTVTLVAILNSKFGRNDFVSFWSFILEGLSFGYSSRQIKEKRFFLVKHLLKSLQRFELRDKQSYDLIKRLCQHVSTFPSNQLIYILDLCIEGIRMGDRKYVCWKDLLPDVLKVLENQPQLAVDGVLIKGIEFRANTVNSLITMNWPIEIITSIADMFRELNLKSSEVNAVLNKFGGLVLTLSPIDLPPLAFQLFSMCSTCTEVMILVLAFDKYFYRFYYKKLFAEMESNSSDFDSIDTFSDKEMREAEETVLHHLNYCTQYKIGETKIFAGLRNFSSMPDLILTPFMISSIISLSSANREPESRRITTSCLLNFLRSVMHNNEHEQKMAKYSAWFRDTLQRKQVQLDYILSVLIDQNKNGQDIITPGLVNLTFTLLKTKNNVPLNSLAMRFLSKFIRKRFVFGHGIVKKLAEWMMVEQDQFQFGECLLMLSVADTFTVSECVKTIKYVMEFFLWLPGDQSMRMMSFILPILKISAVVRDAFIEVLRKAMSSSMKHIRTMAVYGFCMVLKQLNNSNSQRSQSNPSSFCTQNISAFSLISQGAIDSRQYPYRYFDMLTQEIMGLLRSCFASNIVMKRVLYENLQRAVELNPKLVPHVLQFIDWHFRSFFRVPKVTDVEGNFSVIFDKAVRTSPVNAYELQIQDNLGLLVQFVSHCLIKLEEFESEYDVREIKRLLRLAVEKVITKELQFEEKDDNWQPKKSVLLEIQINFLEGLMAYSLLTANLNNDTITHILPLFKIHCKLSETYKNYASISRKQLQKNNKTSNADGSTMKNITINGMVVKNFNSTSLGNIWDFHVIEKFLRLLHEDVVPFATSHNTDVLRSNVKFVRYVLEITAQKIAALRDEPKYKQLAHSKRILKYLADITKVVYERCIRRLGDIWSSFDKNTAALSAECFQQCLQTADVIYKKQFVEIFLKGFDLHSMNNCKQSPDILQNIIDEFMEMEDSPDTVNSYKGNRHDDNSDRKRILQALLQSLEVLYDNFSFTDRITIESYKWLLKFCKGNVVNSENLSLVHKLLFTQRQKTHAGAFFNTIALQLCTVWGAISNEFYDSECPPAFTFKSLTMESAKPYFLYLCQALRKQIDDVEHFILKANNLNFKCRIVTDDERDMSLTQLRSMERSICSQLLHISNALKNLVNACIPLGSSMDHLLKLLMQHYICLKSLTKHFLSRVEVSQVCMQSTKFEFLLRAIGKSLPTNIYALISYIEENVIDKDQENRLNPKADGAKILRETKLIPKVVLHLESFNRFVIILSKKTNSRISNLLHQGTVHDFRFRTHALTAAVQRTFSLSREISVDFSDENMTEKEIKEDYLEITMDELPTVSRKMGKKLERNDEHSDNINEAEETLQRAASKSVLDANSNHSATGLKSSKRKLRSCDNDNDGELFSIDIVDSATRPSSVSDNVEVLEHESNQESASQLFKNLAKINKKAKKRGFKDIDDNAVVNAGVIIPPKKRRDRTLIKK
ncbi:Fanconi anemia group I protein isoform X1 [Bactrocera neohumeralis]|uniref:Fanconi anemia group I protein isoform X1 n=1 Tax=Bactrocera neohumeralis TaxID=98809 RepID=UPI0021665D5F|nr:Fanconi anemia group I protein isoform X1 [Bactrocera neohumeralis]